jgi:hypothetical protein
MSPTRTTVTLDPDVAEQLKALARRRNISFKTALNSAVRAGLAAERGGGRPFRTPTWPMGLRPGVDLTHALQMAADLEDEEILRKLELRK